MIAPTYADLKIDLEREASGGYRVRLSFRLDTSAADEDFGVRSPTPVVFDLEALRAASFNPQKYGQMLTAALLADESVRRGLTAAHAQARAHSIPLRLRLALDPEDTVLHGLRWEWLQDPDDGALLALSECVLLSRYQLGGTGEPISLPEGRDLRALVVIANPSDLSRFNLAPLNVSAEQQRIVAALGSITYTLLVSGTAITPTLANLLSALHDGYEILIIVAHGSLQDSTPYLWLEQSDGSADKIAGNLLSERLKHAQQRPQLAILAACEGAGRDNGTEPLTALGPRLVATGIPAVVAMQGTISIAAVSALLPTLLTELRRDGCIDQAMAAARRAAERERADWWRPTLTMRVRDGRLWHGTLPAHPPREGVNPFIAGNPVPPDIFYGRRDQIMSIKDRIGGMAPQCVSIVGFRRSGKSSLLRYVREHIHEFCSQEQQPLIVSLSLSDQRFHTPAGITEGLRRGIEHATGSAPWRYAENDDPWAIDDGLQTVRDRGRRLIVLIDEFEQIGARLVAFEGWGGDWREKASVQGYFALVLATQRPIDTIYKELGLTSPFGNIFTTVELGAFATGEWHALVRDGFTGSGVDLREADLVLLDELAGGLPFYVQLASQLLWRHSDHPRTRAEFALQAEPFFAKLWRDLSEQDRHALRHAAGLPRLTAPVANIRERLQRHGIGLPVEMEQKIPISGTVYVRRYRVRWSARRRCRISVSATASLCSA